MEYETVNVTPEMLKLLKQDEERFHLPNMTKLIEKFRNSYYKIVPPLKKIDEVELKRLPEALRKFSIVPELLNFKQIQFLDKYDEEISICKKSLYRYQDHFLQPWMKVLTEKGRRSYSPNRPENIKSMDFEKLKILGFGIAVKGTKLFHPWFKGQQKQYILYKLTDQVVGSRMVDYCPTSHYLQQDINNRRIRIVGQNTNPSGRGVWLNINDGSKVGYAGKVVTKRNPLIRSLGGEEYISEHEKWKRMKIGYIPLMITEDQKLLCLPNFQETKHIGIVGATGTCKSLFLNVLMSWEYWLLNRHCVSLNDYQDQTKELSLPTDSFTDMRKRINAEPCGLPLVYLFPSTDSLQIDKKDKLFPYLKVALPLEEVIKNIEDYYELGRSSVYFENLRSDLLKCNSFRQMIEVVEENFPEKQQKAMRYKMISVLKALDKRKIADISTDDAHAHLKYIRRKEKKMYVYGNGEKGNPDKHPIITLMRAGFIPSVLTGNLWNEIHFSPYMAYLINMIYKNQKKDK